MGRKKKKASLSAEGYSIHTIEVKTPLTATEWNAAVNTGFKVAKKNKTHMYRYESQAYCYTGAAGMRLYYTMQDRKGNVRPYVKAVINPRKLIDRNSSYLGIMPVDEESLTYLFCRFTDVTRQLKLPEFFEDWSLSRVDLCANLMCQNARIARELIRTARKLRTPPKYQRAFTENKHVIHFQAGAIAVVLYDKSYQILEERLKLQDEKLPNGVLRIEVQYDREYIRRAAKTYGTKGDSQRTLKALVSHSKSLMLKHIRRCFSQEDFYSPNRQLEKIKLSDFSPETQARMCSLALSLRKKNSIEAALKAQKWDKQEQGKILLAFAKIGVSPIPLRKRFYREQLLSIPHILQQVDSDGSSSVVVEDP